LSGKLLTVKLLENRPPLACHTLFYLPAGLCLFVYLFGPSARQKLGSLAAAIQMQIVDELLAVWGGLKSLSFDLPRCFEFVVATHVLPPFFFVFRGPRKMFSPTRVLAKHLVRETGEKP